MYFGAPISEPFSIISKSIIKLSAAIATTNKEKPIPNIPPPLIKGMVSLTSTPNLPIINVAR